MRFPPSCLSQAPESVTVVTTACGGPSQSPEKLLRDSRVFSFSKPCSTMSPCQAPQSPLAELEACLLGVDTCCLLRQAALGDHEEQFPTVGCSPRETGACVRLCAQRLGEWHPARFLQTGTSGNSPAAPSQPSVYVTSYQEGSSEDTRKVAEGPPQNPWIYQESWLLLCSCDETL